MYNFANGMAPYASYSEAFTPQDGTISMASRSSLRMPSSMKPA